MARAEAAGANALAVFTAATDAFTEKNIGMTIDESLAAFEPVLRRAADLGWWRRGVRLDRVRLSVHGRRSIRTGGRVVATRLARPRRRRGLLRRHDRRRRARARSPSSRARPSTPGSALDRSRTTSTTLAERRSRTSRRGLDAGDPLLRQLDRRDGRLPLRARRRGESRHRGPRVPARRVRVRAWRRPRGRPRRGAIHHAGARKAARVEGRPGRLGRRPAGDRSSVWHSIRER